jgi:SAM-dependent methyltransferase
MHMDLIRAKQTVRDYHCWEYEEIKRIYKEFDPYWDLQGKVVLDVGCGLGGKLPFYVRQGAKQVIGIDLRLFSALSANRLLLEQGGSEIKIAVADGAELPFADSTFDVVISINVLEHVAIPISVLKECRRVLRPGGYFYLYFPPFYSPWGAHLDSWINFPWPHLFFPEQIIVQAASLVEEQVHYNEQFILPARVPWGELQELYELNRLTIRQFIKLVREADFRVLLFRLLPLGHQLLRQNVPGKILLTLLRRASQIPVVNEIVVTKIVCVLTK